MKSNKLILLALSGMLIACGQTTSSTASSGAASSGAASSSAASSEAPYSLDLKVATPTGAPAVAFYRHLADESHLEVNSVPKNVLAYLSKDSDKDIVVAPTHGGVKACLAGAPFKIAATLTFGNFYIAATGNDDNATLDADDYVVAFQENDVPGKVFKYCYPELSNVHFLTGEKAAADAATCLVTGKNSSDDNAAVDYVFVAEPSLTATLSKAPNASEYASIREKFATVSGGKKLTQASLFVRNDADQAKVRAFLASIKADMASFLANPSVLEDAVKDLRAADVQSKFNATPAVLKNLTSNGNRMGLGYKDAYANKESVASFLGLWNMSIDEEVYYK